MDSSNQPPTQPPAAPPPPPSQAPASWAPQSPPPPPGSGGFNFNDFITFRYLITPGFITVIYVVGAIFITLGALATVANASAGGGIAALVFFVLGNIWWRIVTEFVMVLFRINDSLSSIDRRGRGL